MFSEFSDLQQFKASHPGRTMQTGYGGYKGNGFKGLGKYGLDMGQDERGTFISVTDTNDYLSPFGVDPLGAGVGIYDRVYYKKDKRGNIYYQTGDARSSWKRWSHGTKKADMNKVATENATRGYSTVVNYLGDKFLGYRNAASSYDTEFKKIRAAARRKGVTPDYSSLDKYIDKGENPTGNVDVFVSGVKKGLAAMVGYVAPSEERAKGRDRLIQDNGYYWNEGQEEQKSGGWLKTTKQLFGFKRGGILYKK